MNIGSNIDIGYFNSNKELKYYPGKIVNIGDTLLGIAFEDGDVKYISKTKKNYLKLYNEEKEEKIIEIDVNDEQEEKECPICYENFGKRLNKAVQCPKCFKSVCKQCLRQYIITENINPQCPQCTCEFTRTFLIKNLDKSFVFGKLQAKRKKILVDMEKAKLPDVMPIVESYKKKLTLQKEIKVLSDITEQSWRDYADTGHSQRHLYELYRKNRSLQNNKRGALYHTQLIFNRLMFGDQNNTRRTFKQACGGENCRGFLSPAWKCNVCENYTCQKCLCIKGKDRYCIHKCNKDHLLSAQLIKKETRNCPSCAVPIFKIHGCDQMWCTLCNIAFDWKTGKKVKGKIHNPHYFEWKRTGGKQKINQNTNCGIPLIEELDICINCCKQNNNTKYDISYITNNLIHNIRELFIDFQDFHNRVIVQLQNKINKQIQMDNKDLKLRYLINDISEKWFAITILKRDNLKYKYSELQNIYELLDSIISEEFLKVTQQEKNTFLGLFDCIQNIYKALEFANNLLNNLSINYNCKIKYFNKNRIRLI